jgi:hypothetical protein
VDWARVDGNAAAREEERRWDGVRERGCVARLMLQTLTTAAAVMSVARDG